MRVDDAVQQRARAFAEHAVVARADLGHAQNRTRRAVVKGDEILRPEEEIDFLRPELVLTRLEIDAVQDQIEVVAVGLDLRMMDFGERVLDGQLVEVKRVGEYPGFFWCGRTQVGPHPDPAVGLQPGGIHTVDNRRGPALVLVDGDQSPTLTCSAACAAARRATGMRYGEALT